MQGRTITFSRNVFLPLTTACRNRCSYCCFRTPVREGCILSPEAVERTLRLGAETGCTEALFTFGERPEQEPGFAELLSASSGYSSILDYCFAMSERALQHGLLPHTNAGILTSEEMERLREVNASMGLMLETTARVPAHRHSPGKVPEVRIQMLEDAGRLRIPFTTGILVGIGESESDREESLTVIRDLHRRYGHIQEVIVQNFCAKENTPMAAAASPTSGEICRAIALAREILPRDVAVQIAPNLVDAARFIRCGANDLGGISPCTIDYVNPEHPWPQIPDLKILAGSAALQERLCIYPQYIEKGWFHPRIEALIRALAQQIQERRW
ncbi:MAG: 7,8-didemethyl-8-hydroxy-5-deazariboflavin synthase subunit CofG [Methanomicrobiales archaeon]|nr:7,8-didemethyl-8-hydroxy-5-deazariboflavin synthase subunit CofG [Methanomicrobiales archaeon]MDI6875384.1 7,8-didemethyl-8-hydroxy-5-deazariboflavin synthase subunit CofG [Methanomicrobiales archaeon]